MDTLLFLKIHQYLSFPPPHPSQFSRVHYSMVELNFVLKWPNILSTSSKLKVFF